MAQCDEKTPLSQPDGLVGTGGALEDQNKPSSIIVETDRPASTDSSQERKNPEETSAAPSVQIPLDPKEKPATPPHENIIARARSARVIAREESRTTCEYISLTCKRWCSIFTGCIVWSLVVIFAISSIVIGRVHVDNCTVEPKIPKYVVSIGGLFLIVCVYRLYCFIRTDFCHVKQPISRTTDIIFHVVIGLCMFGWWIAGQVWVFKNLTPNFEDIRSGKHCNRTVYWYAFAVTLLLYLLFGAICFLLSLISYRTGKTSVY